MVEENDPFEEDIVFDQTGLLGNKPYARQQAATGFLPTFMLFIRTVYLCVAFVSLGLCASVSQGPVINLEVAVGLPVELAFHTFTASSVGMLLGGLLGSKLFEIYNRQFLIFISLMWMAVSITVLPFTIPLSYWWTLTTVAVLGAGMAFIFTGSNVLCLDLWGRQGGASLQALHFSFALGAFIAPVVIHPFISSSYPTQFAAVSPDNSSVTPLAAPQTQRIIRSLIYNESDSPVFSATDNRESRLQDISDLKLTETIDQLMEPQSNLNRKYEGVTSESSSNALSSISSHFQRNVSKGNIASTDAVVMAGEVNESSSKSNNTISKPAKPKPSFTNANLIPESSKWQRPSQKEIAKPIPATTSTDDKSPQLTLSQAITTNHPGVPIGLVDDTETVTNKHLTSNNSSEFSPFSTSVAGILSDDRNSEKYGSGIPTLDSSHTIGSSSVVEKEIDATTKEIPLVFKSSTDSTGLDGASVMVHDSVDIVNASSIPEVITAPSVAVTNAPDVMVTRSWSSSASSVHEASASPLETKYVIDFNNSSYSEVFGSDKESGYQDDFTDYSTVKKAFTEPEVENLKESPDSDLVSEDGEESSAITVAASFSDNDASTHSLIHQAKPGTFSNISDGSSHFIKTIVEKFKNYGVTSIHVVYICTGSFMLVIALTSVCIMCQNPREPRSKQEDGNLSDIHKASLKVFLIVFSIYMFTAEALQGAIHHLLASSHTDNGFPIVNRSMDGQAIFWGLVSTVRFLCIIASGCLKVKPSKILVGSTLFMFMGTIFLCIGSFNKKDFLWGGIVVVALGLAPILPTCFLWMAEQMKVTHRMCALMIIVSSFGNTVTHTTLTHILANSHLYSYVLVGISISSLIFLTASFCFLYRTQSCKSVAVPLGYQLASQDEDEMMELSRSVHTNFDISRRLNEMGEAGQALLID